MSSPSTAQLELIQKLEDVGILSPETADLARERYVSTSTTPFDAADRSAAIFTISNCAKAFGVFSLLLALVAFVGLLAPWLAKAPVELYQAPMLASAVFAMLRPHLIWRSQARYVALLATFSTFIICSWIIGSHEAITKWLDKLDDAGWPVTTLLAATAMTFFVSTALLHRSPPLTLAAAACLTAALVGDGDSGALPHSVAGHALALAAHITVKVRGTHPKLTYLFTYAAEYYCTIALGFTLWIGSFAWDGVGAAVAYSTVFAMLCAAAGAVYYRLGIKTPASILTCFAVVLLLTWLQYWTDSAGAVVSFVVCGVALFGFGLLLERHRHFLVFELPKEPPAGGAPAAEGSTALTAVGAPMLGEGPAAVTVGSGRLEEC